MKFPLFDHVHVYRTSDDEEHKLGISLYLLHRASYNNIIICICYTVHHIII